VTTSQRELVDRLIRERPLLPADATLEDRRADFTDLLTARPVAAGVSVESGALGGRPALRLTPATSAPGTLLYLHGGGYVLGSATTGSPLASQLATRTGLTTWVPDYRLAPEHPFPAGLDDAVAAYRELLAAEHGPTVVAGDSAGGGLTVALLLAAREAGLPQPAAAVVFSPWVDLAVSGDSARTKEDEDPYFTAASLRGTAALYTDRPAEPLTSPVLADLHGIAPLLVQVGSREVLLDDAVRLVARAAAADVDVTLEAVGGVPHVFQSWAGVLDEASDALDRAAEFVRVRTSG
jgi:epsilon-lactone hydrolase